MSAKSRSLVLQMTALRPLLTKNDKLLRCLEGWSELSRGQTDCRCHHPSLQRSIAQIGLSQELEPTSAWQFLASLEDAFPMEQRVFHSHEERSHPVFQISMTLHFKQTQLNRNNICIR